MLSSIFHLPFKQFMHGQKIFSILIRSTSFGCKFQELFNAFLISKAHATYIHPTSIHLRINFVFMHENLTFFIKGVALPHSRRYFFIVDSYIKVKYLFLNLTKFWQHFVLIFKYMKWKRWCEFHHNQVCTQRTKWNALYQNFIKFKKKNLTYTYVSRWFLDIKLLISIDSHF